MPARFVALCAIIAVLSSGCQSMHYSADRGMPAGQIVGDSMTMGGSPAAALQPGYDEAAMGYGSCTDCMGPSGPPPNFAADGYYGDGVPCQPYLQGRMGWGRGATSANRKQLFDGRVRDCIQGHCANGWCGGAAGPDVGAVTYPYYTTRGPRDFLLANPPGIGP